MNSRWIYFETWRSFIAGAVVCAILTVSCPAAIAWQNDGQAIVVPDQFTITKVATNELATNIYSLTVDANGAVVVAGPGYVRRLIDDNSDGIFDRAQQISSVPKNGAMGLYFDGNTLYAVGDQGVLRMTDPDGDGVLGTPEVMLRVKTGGEHDAHAIRKGPDGNWYLLCGNGVSADSIGQTQANFVEKPHAGFLLRASADFSVRTILNDGFRNPYDFDFNSDGAPFTFDSDGERDISLPWYQPCRVYRLKPGDDAGWMSASHKLADQHPYMPEVIGRLGRGSPTGVVCYRHFQFPSEFYDAIFVLDWTNGRIVCHKRDPRTGKYLGGEVFAQPRGVAGFAVTDAEVGSDGSLYVSVGGRGTAGGVYRIQAKSAEKNLTESALARAGVIPQPNFSWARKGRDSALDAGRTWRKTLEMINRRSDSTLRLLQQIDFTHEACGPIPADLVEKLNPRIGDRIRARLASARSDVTRENQPRADAVVPVWKSQEWPSVFDGYYVPNSLPEFEQEFEKLHEDLEDRLNESDESTFRRTTRLLAISGHASPKAHNILLDRITSDSDPVEDIHCLIVLSRISQSASVEQKTKLVAALLNVPRKLKQRNLSIDRNWPIRMRELAGAMVREFELEGNFCENDDLLLTENLYLLEILSENQKSRLRAKLAEGIVSNKSYATAEHVGLLASDPENRYRGQVRKFRDQPNCLDVVVRCLAADPLPADRDCFLRGLAGPNRVTWRLAANGLRKLPVPVDRDELIDDSLTVLKCGLQLGTERSEIRVRESIVRLLGHWHRGTNNGTILQWRGFFSERYPEQFAKRIASNGMANLERLRKLDFSSGDAVKGKVVYERLLCAKCHDGGRRLGPDLAGLANRFSEADILNAVLDPDQQVPQRYRALKVQTVDGKLFLGAVIYESVDGIVMSDRNGNTIRIEAENVEQRAFSNKSLMPSGLLDNATDEHVIDLMTFLKSQSKN